MQAAWGAVRLGGADSRGFWAWVSQYKVMGLKWERQEVRVSASYLVVPAGTLWERGQSTCASGQRSFLWGPKLVAPARSCVGHGLKPRTLALPCLGGMGAPLF